NEPSPWADIAHDESTTACPCAARRHGPPGSDGPSAMPIARKREFIIAAAATAAPTPPPAPTIASAANCAEPANTTTDIAITAAAGMPTSRASTPKDSDSRNPATANGAPARRPARKAAVRVTPDSLRPAVGSFRPMDFEPSDRCKDFRERLLAFMDERVYPAEAVYEEQLRAAGDPHAQPAVMEELK